MSAPNLNRAVPIRPSAGTARRGPSAGFTLVELMVALALAAMISVAIMVISSQAQIVYRTTTRKVDVYNKFRYALLTVERDFQQWIPTSNLEPFMDGRGAGSRRNLNWDPGEEVPDPPGKAGLVNGGRPHEYDEFGYILERHYYGYEDPEESERKVHDAYQAYFRTMTYIDGRIREANIEYMLVDPTRFEPGKDAPVPPTEVKFADMPKLSLYKIIRYHDIDYGEIQRLSQNFPVVRKDVEICTNITDFKIEYTTENRYDPKVGTGFRTPREDHDNPTERAIMPLEVKEASISGFPALRKTFGYGTFKIPFPFPKAYAFPAIFGDRTPRMDHRPVRFGWERNPEIYFAELTPGDTIYIFTESARGGGSGGGIGVAGMAGALTQFPVGDYTVKTNLSGRLEFIEDIDSTTWGQRNQPNIYYKAAFLPGAVRITMRVLEETDQADRKANTMQKVIWIRRKAR